MSRIRSLSFALTVAPVLGLGMARPADSRAEIKAGAAQRNITPPIGFEIQHYYCKSIGVHDPRFARCLYLEDDSGNSVAVV